MAKVMILDFSRNQKYALLLKPESKLIQAIRVLQRYTKILNCQRNALSVTL